MTNYCATSHFVSIHLYSESVGAVITRKPNYMTCVCYLWRWKIHSNAPLILRDEIINGQFYFGEIRGFRLPPPKHRLQLTALIPCLQETLPAVQGEGPSRESARGIQGQIQHNDTRD